MLSSDSRAVARDQFKTLNRQVEFMFVSQFYDYLSKLFYILQEGYKSCDEYSIRKEIEL